MKKLIALVTIALVAGISSATAQALTPIASFDDINLWAGSQTGTNRSALVVDFGGDHVFVWGFRWNDGEYGTQGPTGADMMNAITARWKELEIYTGFPNSIYYTPFGGAKLGDTSGTKLPDFDYYFWAYFGVGGEETVRGNFSEENNFLGEVIGSNPIPGGGLTPPSSGDWVYLWCVPEERYLENGSWDAFVFTNADLNWDPILSPSGTIFSAQAIPEPTACALMLASSLALFALHRRKASI